MDGILVINKEENMTSRDVVNKLIPLFNTKKIGHTGTLDPIARGVLVCCIGKYTKLVNELTSLDKEYIAEVKIKIKTDTGDITGNIIDQNNKVPKKEDIINSLNSFLGSYNQIVPKYSAIKIKGKKLYEYARNNEEVVLPKRLVHIYSIELLAFDNDVIKFKVKVSKGTYIRSLIEDICKKLNILGTMSSLIRIKQGNFSLDEAYTIDNIKNNNYKLLKVEDVFNYPKINLDEETYHKVKNGALIFNNDSVKDKVLCMYNNKCVAIYKNEDNYLKSYIQL